MRQPPTTPEPMSLTRFGALVEAYGGELARWPEAEQTAARTLLEREPEAQRLLSEALSLDGLLGAYEVAEPLPRLRAKVLEVPIAAERSKRRFGWRLAWAVAASTLIGVVSGAYSASELDPASDDEEWTELAAV
jgi:hypothetical protein